MSNENYVAREVIEGKGFVLTSIMMTITKTTSTESPTMSSMTETVHVNDLNSIILRVTIATCHI